MIFPRGLFVFVTVVDRGGTLYKAVVWHTAQALAAWLHFS